MPGQVVAAVNGWIRDTITGAVTPLAAQISQLLDPNRLAGVTRLHQIWDASRTTANGLFVLLILLGGMVVMTYGTVHTRWALKEILPRLVLAFLAVNLSWTLITTALQLSVALAVSAGEGLTPGQVLGGLLVRNVIGGGFALLLGAAMVVLAVVLVLSLVVFTAVLMLLIVAAPLALCTHALPQTEWIAHRWWQALAATLAVPTVYGLILALIARVLFTPDGYTLFGFTSGGAGSVNILVLIALLYVLIKIPRWAWSQITTSTGASRAGQRRTLLGRLVRTVVAYKTLGLLGGAAGTLASKTAAATGGTNAAGGAGGGVGGFFRNLAGGRIPGMPGRARQVARAAHHTARQHQAPHQAQRPSATATPSHQTRPPGQTPSPPHPPGQTSTGSTRSGSGSGRTSTRTGQTGLSTPRSGSTPRWTPRPGAPRNRPRAGQGGMSSAAPRSGHLAGPLWSQPSHTPPPPRPAPPSAPTAAARGAAPRPAAPPVSPPARSTPPPVAGTRPPLPPATGSAGPVVWLGMPTLRAGRDDPSAPGGRRGSGDRS